MPWMKDVLWLCYCGFNGCCPLVCTGVLRVLERDVLKCGLCLSGLSLSLSLSLSLTLFCLCMSGLMLFAGGLAASACSLASRDMNKCKCALEVIEMLKLDGEEPPSLFGCSTKKRFVLASPASQCVSACFLFVAVAAACIAASLRVDASLLMLRLMLVVDAATVCLL
jgi:hypothetical protein